MLLDQSEGKKPKTVPIPLTIFCCEVKAHSETITIIRPILEEPFGFVTSSEDKRICFFGEYSTDIVGIIDLRSDRQEMAWGFNYDWDGERDKIIQSARQI